MRSFLALSTLTLTTSVEVELGMHLDIPESGVQASGQIIKWITDTLTNTSTPSTRFGIQLQLPLLNRYGCWCYRGADYPGGRGIPQDDYDEACKAMHMGYDCVVSDSDTEENSCVASGDCCNPVDTDYLWFIKPSADYPGSYTFECAETIEMDWCRARVCQIDLRFVSTFFELITYGIYPDRKTFGHIEDGSNGEFDPSTCPEPANIFDYTDIITGDVPAEQSDGGIGGGGVATTTTATTTTELVTQDRVCCGEYPFRSWFNKFSNDDRECCEYEEDTITDKYSYSVLMGKMFHSSLEICCADGVVSGSTVC